MTTRQSAWAAARTPRPRTVFCGKWTIFRKAPGAAVGVAPYTGGHRRSSCSMPALHGSIEKGVLVDVLLEGSYAMRSGSPLLVTRDDEDGPVEAVAADAEVVLATG